MRRRAGLSAQAAGTLLLVAFLVAAGTGTAAGDEGKSLYWQQLTVRARLDADGRMHVSERHVMVFNGDWNGGYRELRVNFDQSLYLERLIRIDEHGGEVVLVEGDLDRVDFFGWSDGTLRWRSRRSEDPPFQHQTLTYVLDYTLSGILLALDDGAFWMNHDFAFPNRDGMIEKFTLEFAIDPAWQPTQKIGTSFARDYLPPGESFIIDASLRYVGNGRPADVFLPVSFETGRWVLVVLAASLGILGAAFIAREAAVGRFRSLRSPAQIDDRWLQDNVLKFLPEEVGAVWDDDVGPPEVAALMARLEAEGKIRTKVETEKGLFFPVTNLHMWLTAPRSVFEGVAYEKALVEAFFVSDDETDAKQIRARYRTSGFDPAARIAARLKHYLRRHPELREQGKPPSRYPSSILMAAGALLAAGAVVNRPSGIPAVVFFTIPSALLCVFAMRQAGRWRKALSHLALRSVPFFVAALAPAAALVVLVFNPPSVQASPIRVDLLLLVGLGLVALGAFALVLRTAAAVDGPTKLEWRQRLAAARNYFRAELRCEQPRLHDAWFPYIIAFGLGSAADRWFRRFGGEQTSGFSRQVAVGSASTGTHGGGSPSGGSASGSWTGGAGQFGGAGAGGTWVSAVETVAAGVSKPSSSGGGGSGGGGGGGSSGGGGGGGW